MDELSLIEQILMIGFLVVMAFGGICILIAPWFVTHEANKEEGE